MGFNSGFKGLIQMGTKHCVTRTHRIRLWLQTEERVRYGQQAVMEK